MTAAAALLSFSQLLFLITLAPELANTSTADGDDDDGGGGGV